MSDKLLFAIEAHNGKVTKKRLDALCEDWQDFDKNKIDTHSEKAIELQTDFENARALGYETLVYNDSGYPEALRALSVPPPVLYIRGNAEALSSLICVTIVGSRESTFYGESVAADFAREFAQSGICVVSGGAVGIDAAAHGGAVSVGGVTIAVAGCGLDVDYPSQNHDLFMRIEKQGAIISEFAPGTKPNKTSFPFRNRIMAALSDATVVVEGGYKSGALITAAQAEKLGKRVFATPGRITDPTSSGVNMLLRDGALFALCAQDVLDEIITARPHDVGKTRTVRRAAAAEKLEKEESTEPSEKEDTTLTALERAILSAIRSGACDYEAIARSCEIDGRMLTAALGMLEIRGIIRLGFGNKYVIN